MAIINSTATICFVSYIATMASVAATMAAAKAATMAAAAQR